MLLAPPRVGLVEGVFSGGGREDLALVVAEDDFDAGCAEVEGEEGHRGRVDAEYDSDYRSNTFGHHIHCQVNCRIVICKRQLIMGHDHRIMSS